MATGRTGECVDCVARLYLGYSCFTHIDTCLVLIGDDSTLVKQKAPEIFSRALSSALQLPELKIPSQRSQGMMSVFEKWSAAIKSNSAFAQGLVSLVVDHAFTPNILKAKSLTTKYEKMWKGYHKLIIGDELSSLWHSTINDVENPLYFKQFMQLVTRRVMDEAVKAVFEHETHPSTPQQDQSLSAEEEQALRYVAGYIPMKLKKQYAKQPNNVRALKYMECLHSMNEEEGDDVEFLQYTKLWVEQVNRGGLYLVNNDTYLVFRAMEIASRRVLSVEHVTSHPSIKIKKEVQESIMNDPAVTTHWNYLLSKVEALDTDESDELLEEIVDKWIKIRGHSFASRWVEQYQLATKQSTRKKGLRKSLQQSSGDPNAQS